MLATGANTMPIAGASVGLSLGSQTPQTNFLQEGYQEALIRLLKAMQEGATDDYIRNLQGQVQIQQTLA